MKVVTDGRRATIVIDYNGTNIDQYLQSFLMSFSYTDAPDGEQDEITLTLDDRDLRWQNAWQPDVGDTIKATITTTNWNKEGDKSKLLCGTFDVDAVEPQGPPDTVVIKAVAIPFAGVDALREKRSKAWEKTRLKTIAQDIAARAKLTLNYQATANPSYDRLDQDTETDFMFLMGIAKSEGISVKVSNRQLVLFNEEEYEKKDTVLTIERGKSRVLSWKFDNTASNTAYSKAVVEYRSSTSSEKQQKKKTVVIRGEYTAPGVKGPILRITDEEVETTAEANRVAKNRLREKNKQFGRASFTLEGDTRIATGITLEIKGWGKFDGKYIVESCTHTPTGAYVTSIEIRKVLGW